MPEENELGTGTIVAQGKQTGGGEKTYSAEHVHELREENKARRLENKELKESVTALQDELGKLKSGFEANTGKKTSGTEDPLTTLQAKFDVMEAALNAQAARAEKSEQHAQQTAIEADIIVRAQSIGLAEGVTPDAILKLINKAGISFDADSQSVGGTDEALTALKGEAAYLFNEKNANTPPAGTPGGGTPRTSARRGDKTSSEKLIDLIKVGAQQGMFTPSAHVFDSPMGNRDRGQYEGK